MLPCRLLLYDERCQELLGCWLFCSIVVPLLFVSLGTFISWRYRGSPG